MEQFWIRNIWGVFLPACLAFSCGCGLEAGEAEEPTFRNLVRRYTEDGDGTKLAKMAGFTGPVKHVVALEYEVLTPVGGTEKAVDPNLHKFKLGDQVRVQIRPLVDAYIYIHNKGADGKLGILLPDKEKQEKAPFVKGGTTVKLPDDGYFEFVPPPGSEELMVVATKEPVADLALLANALMEKPDSQCTPEERKVKKTFTARVKKTLQSIRGEQDKHLTYRGLPAGETRAEFAEKVQRTGTTRAAINESADGASSGAFAMVASTEAEDRPDLFVSIPLKSIARAK